jgi:uncharacterized membrane protein
MGGPFAAHVKLLQFDSASATITIMSTLFFIAIGIAVVFILLAGVVALVSALSGKSRRK